MAKTQIPQTAPNGKPLSKKQIAALESQEARRKTIRNYRIMLAVIAIVLVLTIVIAVVLSQTVFKREDWKEGKAFPTATIEFEGYGTITLELRPDKAPETVRNFITLAQSGFYDNSTIHRVLEDFMIQGGRNIDGKEADNIIGEMTAVNSKNDLKHLAGTISIDRKSVV